MTCTSPSLRTAEKGGAGRHACTAGRRSEISEGGRESAARLFDVSARAPSLEQHSQQQHRHAQQPGHARAKAAIPYTARTGPPSNAAGSSRRGMVASSGWTMEMSARVEGSTRQAMSRLA